MAVLKGGDFMDITFYLPNRYHIPSEIFYSAHCLELLIANKINPESSYGVYYSNLHPQEFKKNKEVDELVTKHGESILPIVFINNKLYRTKGILTIAELQEFTNQVFTVASKLPKNK